MSDYLYKEEILEHYRHPVHFGKPQKFDQSAKLSNPFCGDEIEVFLVNTTHKSAGVDTKTPRGCKIFFTGHGCAISVAASSMLCEAAEGKSLSDLTAFPKEGMLELLGIEVSETRKKCALLGWAALQECLKMSF